MSPNYPSHLRRRRNRLGKYAGRLKAAIRRRDGAVGVPEAMAVIRAYVLDSASGVTELPPIPDNPAHFTASLTALEAGIPDHKWGKLDRMRDVVRHYEVPVAVRDANGERRIP